MLLVGIFITLGGFLVGNHYQEQKTGLLDKNVGEYVCLNQDGFSGAYINDMPVCKRKGDK